MLQRYVYLLRRWIWLLVLTTVIAGAITYVVVDREPSYYQSTARLLFGPGTSSPNVSLNDLRAAGQLLEIYAALIVQRPFLESVISDLKIDRTPSALDKNIEAVTNSLTQILTINVVDKDPDTAMAIANDVADKLVNMSPSNSSAGAELQVQIRDRIARIQDSIGQSEELIQELETKVDNALTEQERIDLWNQISDERARIDDAARVQSSLLGTLDSPTINQVTIVEPAIRGGALSRQLQLKVIVSMVGGLMLGIAIIFAFEYKSDVIKSPDNLVGSTGAPLLGTIVKPGTTAGDRTLTVRSQPNSRTAENYRMFGTKLLLSRNENKVRSVLISSTRVEDNVTEVAANLAVVMAQLGNRVILVDANLRQPILHQYFGLPSRPGLTDMLCQTVGPDALVPVNSVPGLWVLTVGTESPNFFEIIASSKMGDLITQLENQADLVIVAASSLLVYAESLVLASRVDNTIVVAFSGSTHRREIGEMIGNLKSLGVRILGTMLIIDSFEQWMPRSRKTASKEPGDAPDNLQSLDVYVMGTSMVIDSFEQWTKPPTSRRPTALIKGAPGPTEPASNGDQHKDQPEQ